MLTLVVFEQLNSNEFTYVACMCTSEKKSVDINSTLAHGAFPLTGHFTVCICYFLG